MYITTLYYNKMTIGLSLFILFCLIVVQMKLKLRDLISFKFVILGFIKLIFLKSKVCVFPNLLCYYTGHWHNG